MTKRLQVRALRPAERRMLAEKLRTQTLTVRVHQRYRIIGEMARRRTVAETAERVGCALLTVYHWVHRFNASGFRTFEVPPNPKGANALTGIDFLATHPRAQRLGMASDLLRDRAHTSPL